jgi:hypothetical protein
MKIWIQLTIFALALVGLGLFTWDLHKHPPKPPYCEQFANTPSKDIPGQCLRYWNPGK